MTEEHLAEVLKAAGAEKAKDGWQELPEGRHITFYMASGGASLSVPRVHSVRREGALLQLKTVKEELFVVALADCFAGSVGAPLSGQRSAGFGRG